MSVTKTDSETIIGVDEWSIPIVDCPEADTAKDTKYGRFWYTCPECGHECWHEINGKVYYHKLSCSASNGIGYDEERENTTLPHAENCSCNTCEPPKPKK
jgi:phage terminase large subunit GpA-like protein